MVYIYWFTYMIYNKHYKILYIYYVDIYAFIYMYVYIYYTHLMIIKNQSSDLAVRQQ